MTAPLLVTADETLLDELLRLSAAAGTTPDVAHDVPAALRAWAKAPLVLVGADLAEALGQAAPARRDAVFVVLNGPSPDAVFATALAVGAESVAELPRSEGWLVERLTDVVDTGPARGLTIGVVGGSGGSGATTWACALGQVAGRTGPAVVVDLDPLGPGVDRVLGLDLVDGVRWEALGHTTGRLSARALRDSLPRRDGVAVLTWYSGPEPRRLQAFAVREALSAARRGHDTVVVDLPRGWDALTEEVVTRRDHRPDLAGRGRRQGGVMQAAPELVEDVRTFLAGSPGPLTPHRVAEALRASGRPVGDATVLAVHEALRRDVLGAGPQIGRAS